MKPCVRIVALVEQILPLTNHAQVAVIDHRDFDRKIVDRAGHQLLVVHLEATITIDSPDFLPRRTGLSTHRRGDGITHRPQATRVQPGPRLLIIDELRRPHLVLPHTSAVNRVGANFVGNSLNDGLGS